MLETWEKVIPNLRKLLEKAPQKRPAEVSYDFRPNSNSDALICYGLGKGVMAKRLSSWLRKKKRLIFIEDDPSELAHFMETRISKKVLENPFIELHFLEPTLHVDTLLKKILWSLVYLETEFFISKETSIDWLGKFHHFREGIHFTASDYSDFGIRVMKNLFRNTSHPVHKIKDLENAFQGIPACIIGAGPSLEKEIENVKGAPALIFAGGSALSLLSRYGLSPHFAASIDKEAPYSVFKTSDAFDIPFLFQMRMSDENYRTLHTRHRILAPSSGGYPLEDWCMRKMGFRENPIDVGWNVGTFLTKMAHFFGCSPIIWVGMDLAHSQKKQYADNLHVPKSSEKLLRTKNQQGEDSFSQRDWLWSASWFREFAKKHPNTCYNVSEGLDLGTDSIDLTTLPHLHDLTSYVYAKLESLPSYAFPIDKALFPLEKSLRLFEFEVEEKIKDLQEIYEEQREIPSNFLSSFEGEFYDKHLFHLWEIFKPIFIREIGCKPGSFEMVLHQLLFFQQVTQELKQAIHDRSIPRSR